MKGGELVIIDDVDSGLACGCTCPSCNEQLIARKGAERVHHFAHYKAPECSGGLETALHRICKEIIYNSPTFTVPPYQNRKGREMLPPTKIIVDDVQLEKKLGSIIPDIIIVSKDKKLLVEIEVTNPLDFRKEQMIKHNKLAAIAIDAKSLVHEMFVRKDFWLKDDDFRKILVEGIQYKRWINNPKLDALERAEFYTIKDGKEVPKGIVKVVHSFKTGEGWWYYYVDDCPIQRRNWKSGVRQGQFYASTDDCGSCKYCNTMDYGYHMKNGQTAMSLPNTVYCLGVHDGRSIEELD